jgi:hypothetical protein
MTSRNKSDPRSEMFARYSGITSKMKKKAFHETPSSITSERRQRSIKSSSESVKQIDSSKWKSSLLNVNTKKNGTWKNHTTNSNTHTSTPGTMKRTSKKNRWEAAAELMFKQKAEKKDLDISRSTVEKAKFESHVQRMLLGRVKSKSKREFDVIKNQMLIAKSFGNETVVSMASKSLAGFKCGIALDNILKKTLRWGFSRWHRKYREECIKEEFQCVLDSMEGQIAFLKDLVKRQNQSIMATVERKMKQYVQEVKEYSFRRWYTNMLRRRLNLLKTRQEGSENKLCRRVCMKMLNAKLSSAWGAWREHVRLQALLERFVSGFLKRNIVKCLNTWKLSVKESIRNRAICSRVLKRFMNKKLTTIFNTWLSSTKESIKMKYIGQKIIKRMLQKTLTACFNTWLESTKESKRLRSVCERVICRMLKRRLAGCFTTWLSNATENIRLRNVCNRVVKRLFMRQLATCLITWSANVKEQIRLRVVCQRVGARWLKQSLFAILQKWKTYVEQRLQDKSVVRRWLVSVENRETSGAWRSWKLFVQWDHEQEHIGELNALQNELSDLRAAKKKQEDALCRRVCLKMLNAKVCSAWEAWREHCRIEALLSRVGTRWLKQSMVKCLNMWKESTKEAVRLKNVCKRVAARWHKAGLVRVISKWVDLVDQRKADRKIVENWLVSVNNRDISVGWRSWVLFVREEKNSHNLAVLQKKLEDTNGSKIEQAAYQQTELIRERMNRLRTEMSQQNDLIKELRRQLKSQEKVGIQISKLTRDLAITKENYELVKIKLAHAKNTFDCQVMELHDNSGNRMTSLEIQIECEKQKCAAKLEQERMIWQAESTRLASKIDRAKILMEKKRNTICGLRKVIQERDETVSVLDKEKSACIKKIKQLKFQLCELVNDQNLIIKNQRKTEREARARQKEKDDKIIKLDTLEELVGRELKMLNGHLDNCVDTMNNMKSN